MLVEFASRYIVAGLFNLGGGVVAAPAVQGKAFADGQGAMVGILATAADSSPDLARRVRCRQGTSALDVTASASRVDVERVAARQLNAVLRVQGGAVAEDQVRRAANLEPPYALPEISPGESARRIVRLLSPPNLGVS